MLSGLYPPLSFSSRASKTVLPLKDDSLKQYISVYRERMNLKAPIYFSTGLTEKANHYYKLFITWTNQKIRKTFVQRNMFEFKHIKPFDRSYADNPGPMVGTQSPLNLCSNNCFATCSMNSHCIALNRI